MNSQLRKLSALFKLYLADVFAYKAAAVIWVLGDLQVALMMPLVWRSVGGVGGMSPEQVTVYYLVDLRRGLRRVKQSFVRKDSHDGIFGIAQCLQSVWWRTFP